MKELLRRLRNFPGLAAEIGLASLVINVLGLTSSIYSIVVLRRYLAVGLDSTLITLTVGALLAVTFEFILRDIRMRLSRYLSQQSDRELAEAAFTALSQSEYAKMTKLGTEQHREIMGGLAVVQQAYAPFNVVTLFDVPFASIYLAALYFISPFLASIATAVVLFSLLTGFRVQRKMQAPAQDLSRESARQNGYHSTLISAADSVRQFNWLPVLREKWAKQQQTVADLRSSLQQHQNLAQQLGISTAMLMSILMMGFGAREVLAGNLTVATLIGGNILAGRALANINRCGQTFEQFARAGQHLKLLRSFATLPLEKDTGTTLGRVEGRLQFRDLGFMYQGNNSPLFESVHLDLQPGKVLAVCGANGAGKTTMAKLCAGLLEPMRGEISLDGINLKQFHPQWLRSQLAYLPQEPAFFEGSLRENLTTLNRDIEEHELVQLVNKVGLGNFVKASPEGLEMAVSGGGNHLSLGIRRRIALCRALVGGGRVLILDEPTEGLDMEGCRAVAAILNEQIASGATLILMSNDSFITQVADLVLDLDKKPVPELRRKAVGERGDGGKVEAANG